MEEKDTTHKIVREFTIDDVDRIAWLIYHTDLYIMQKVYGKNEKKAYKKIAKVMDLPSSFFSRDHIYGIKDSHGQLMGILIGYTGEESKKFRIGSILKIMGFPCILRILITGPFTLFPLITTKVPPQSYYISNVSVHPQFQGKGLGKVLMREAFKIAHDHKCDKAILDVSIGKDGAIGLYKKLGFSVAKIKKLWFSQEATYTMERPVETFLESQSGHNSG